MWGSYARKEGQDGQSTSQPPLRPCPQRSVFLLKEAPKPEYLLKVSLAAWTLGKEKLCRHRWKPNFSVGIHPTEPQAGRARRRCLSNVCGR